MNTIIKQVLAFSLSLFLIIAPTIQQANAASSWSISSAVSAGSRTVVSATKSGYKSAVNIAPTAGRLALKLGKGANWAALVYAAIQLAPDLADVRSFQPKYSQGTVEYIVKNEYEWVASGYGFGLKGGISREDIARKWCAAMGSPTFELDTSTPNFTCYNSSGVATHSVTPVNQRKSDYTGHVSISDAAAQMIKNANAGHADSQAAIRETATEMVIGGQFDQDLLQGAVPINDTKPLVPSVPISGNGNVTHGSDTGIGDDGMSGATPGQQADAAKDAAEAAKKAAQAAADAAKDAADSAREAADNAADLVNSGADAAAIAAAEAAKAAADKAAADAKAVSDAAIAAANERAAAAERAAEAATQAAQAAADKAAADVAAAKAAGDAAAIAAAEAAKAAADAAVADAKAKQAAAEKAAEKAKAEAAKPFELPAFCSWATPVCDAVDWLMKPAPDLGDDTALDIDDTDVMPVSTDINFGGSCPANFEFNGSMFGNPINIVLLDTSKFCSFLSTFVKFPVYAASSLFALYILGGRKDV